MAWLTKVALVMGSPSDRPVVEPAIRILKRFEVGFAIRELSAHRTPDDLAKFVNSLSGDGIGIIIAAAGKAAHLAGAIAARTILPVIGLPIKSAHFGGLEALLSTVEMPAGTPVATVGVNAAENAAILALQILALTNGELMRQLSAYKTERADKLRASDASLPAWVDSILL